jgi:hypothetical protein
MPAFETMDRYSNAVYWPTTGNDAYGQPVLGTPVDIKVRWNGKQRQVLDPNGNIVSFDAEAVVNQNMNIGDRLWKGKKADLPGDLIPTSDWMHVKTFDDMDDLKKRVLRRTVLLMRV